MFVPHTPDSSAYAPVTFAPPIVPVPSRGLVDGTTVAVTAAGVPSGVWSVAQCATTYAGPSAGPSEPHCGPSTPVASTGGSVSGTIVANDPLVPVDGTEIPCGYTGCALVLRSGDGAWRGRAGVSFGPPAITVQAPSLDPVADAQFTLAGLPGTQAEVRQCAGPVGTDTCDAPTIVDLDSVGAVSRGIRRVSTLFTAESGAAVDCRVTPCSLVVVGGDGTALASAVIPFRTPPTLFPNPSVALLDGQSVAVEGAGFDTSTGHAVYQCLPGGRPSGEPWCGDALAIVPESPDGTFSTSVAVSARMSGPNIRPVYCRAQCALAVWTPDGWVLAPFSMAGGTVDVTPTAGLADGDDVNVVGAELQPTYAGLPIGPWPTGGAAVAQCRGHGGRVAEPVHGTRRLLRDLEPSCVDHRVDRRRGDHGGDDLHHVHRAHGRLR